MRTIVQIFVAFSEKLNFNNIDPSKCLFMRNSASKIMHSALYQVGK